MGQNAVYISIDDSALDALWQLDDQSFRDRFLEIEEDQSLDRLDIGKIWDVLHCTLTDVTARKPIEGNKLSESIVGVHPKYYDDEDYSMFVSVIDNSEIDGILLELKTIDLVKLRSNFKPELLKKQNVYPSGIWNDRASTLVAEMDAAMHSIREFFYCSLRSGNHILATIL